MVTLACRRNSGPRRRGLLTNLLRSGIRHGVEHRWQSLLTLACIVMGVAIVVAVDLANESAKRAFALSLDTVSGRSTHRITGGSSGIDESVFVDLRRQLGLVKSAPMVSDQVSVKGQLFTLIGIDPLSEFPLERFIQPVDHGQSFDLISRGDAVVLSRRGAEKLAAKIGTVASITYRGQEHLVTVAAIITGSNPAAEEGLIIADIATAQELLDRVGRLDRIDLTLSPAQEPMVAAWLPPNLKLVESETRNKSTRQMTDAFHINLTAMSLLALLVGGLLIRNTMTFSVLQRRQSLGIFRGLGVTRGEIFGVLLLEAAIYAAIGTALGIAGGLLLAQFLIELVLRTINDLYFVLTVSDFLISPLSLLKGVLLGIGVTLLAAFLPALEATRSPPISVQQLSTLERRTTRQAVSSFLIGVIMLVGGWLLSRVDGLGLIFAFFSLALLVLGFTLCVPIFLYGIVRLLHWMLAPSLSCESRMVLRGISRGLSRTGLAVAALTVAVATSVGMGVMVNSFRHSVEQWLAHTLSGDIYISVAGRTSARGGPGLPPELIRAVQSMPGVSAVDSSRVLRAETEFGELQLMAIDIVDSTAPRFQLKVASADLPSQFSDGKGILISEPLANHRGLVVGDAVQLNTDLATVKLPVLGVFYDYTSTVGTIALDRDLYRQWWRDDRVDSLAVHLRPDADLQQTRAEVRALAAQFSDIAVTPSGEIRERSLEIFDRTFAITLALRLLTVIVAFIGIFGALMALQLERMRELAVLRAVGFTPRGIIGMVTGQSMILGIFAGLLALPLGIMMADVLVDVINLRSFGWSMGFTIPPRVLLEGFALAILAAVLAGCYPAYRAASTSPVGVLRSE